METEITTMFNKGDLALGIESAIGGGSISLFRDGVESACWLGESNVSRAEELLPNIDRLLSESSLTIEDVTTIAVSTGPGSYTGIKIGIATVLGLRAALGVKCVGISALEALYFSLGGADATVAVPIGRDMVCIQSFSSGDRRSAAAVLDIEALSHRFAAIEGDSTVVVHHQLCDHIAGPVIIDAGMNIAKYLCMAADSVFASEAIEPLFVQRAASEKS